MTRSIPVHAARQNKVGATDTGQPVPFLQEFLQSFCRGLEHPVPHRPAVLQIDFADLVQADGDARIRFSERPEYFWHLDTEERYLVWQSRERVATDELSPFLVVSFELRDTDSECFDLRFEERHLSSRLIFGCSALLDDHLGRRRHVCIVAVRAGCRGLCLLGRWLFRLWWRGIYAPALFLFLFYGSRPLALIITAVPTLVQCAQFPASSISRARFTNPPTIVLSDMMLRHFCMVPLKNNAAFL